MRIAAQAFSLVFHPIFMAVYMLLLLMWINPYLFGASDWTDRMDLLILMLPTSVIIPIICILLMKPLGFIESLEMKERTERILPYISTAILYSWLFINILKQNIFPRPYAVFFLGILMAMYLAFFINNFSKISAHAVGAGGLLGMILLTRNFYSYGEIVWHGWDDQVYFLSMDSLVIGAIIFMGLMGTVRLYLNAHDRNDIYGGYIVGFSTQLIAYQILA